MAEEKKVPLSIILRTVDRATAGIKAVNERLDALTKPTRDFGKALSDLGDKSGFNRVSEAMSGVGSAIGDLIGKVALVGGAIGVAVAGVLSLVDHFDKLGDTAERLGTSADFLAAFRYAAERAGAPVEGVDEALQSLVQNMGQAKAGTGRMLKFLNQISPVLARQVVSANSLEEALGLLADAEAKLPDAARRAALAQKTLGNAALAPLLARGSAGVQELLTQFYGLAGGLGDATEAAGKTDDALKNMHAASEGVKAALVTGLAPALTVIIGKITTWLVDHREDVKRWAQDIGDKLPAAVDRVVKAVSDAVGWVAGFVDDIGGWKVAASALALVMAGPLLSAVATLGIALTATPFGLVVAGLAAITAGVITLTIEINKMIDAMDTSHERMLEDLTTLPKEEYYKRYPHAKAGAEQFRADYDAIFTPSQQPWSMMSPAAPTAPAWMMAAPSDLAPLVRPPPPAGTALPETRIKIDFMNAPRGLRATAEPGGGAGVDMTVGYQLAGGGV